MSIDVTPRDAIQRFYEAIRAAGITPPDEIIADGKLRRFPTNGRRGDDAGYYVLHDDGIPAGMFGDFRTGIEQTWRVDLGRKLTFAEAEALKRKADTAHKQREAEERRRHAEARERATAIWQAARPAPEDHLYLKRKTVQSHGIREHQGWLLIPMHDAAGELHSLQFIAPDGRKRFLPGGRVEGCYFSIGKPGDRMCIAEGYATAASVHEATGYAVAVAFDAGNLERVARALQAKMPDARITVCADDDYRTAGNPGLAKATEAARARGGLLAVPDFGAHRPDGATDFNDLAQHAGLESVKQAIANARAPKVPEAQPKTPGATAGDLSGPVVEIVRGDAIKPEPVEWLWAGYLAAGMLHLIAGAPGTGKTTLALACAATVSAGGRWPDKTRATPGDVLIWSGEDAPANTLVPRLIAMGADMTRIHIVRAVNEADGERRWFDPADDFPALALAAARLPALRLMIVDPIVSAVAGDSHKNSETRRGLQPLVEFAEGARCALQGVTHFSKASSGRDPIERVTGSIAFAAVARIIMATAMLPEDEGGGRLFVRAKSNIGPDGGGFRYELRQGELDGECRGIIASHVEWGEPIAGTAREILATAESATDPAERSERAEAADWLKATLAEAGGEMCKADIIRAAVRAGYKERTMHRARAAAGVSADVSGFGAAKRSVWRLARDASVPPIVPIMPPQEVGTHRTNEGTNAEPPRDTEVF